MSSSPAPSASHSSSTASGQATQAAGRAGAQGAKKPGGQETGADLFANLLSLLSATNDPLPVADGLPAELVPDTTDTPAAESGEADLEALMAWAALPSASAPATGTPGAVASGADPAPRGLPATAPGAELPAQATAPDRAPADALQGLQVLDQPEALDEQTLARLSANAATDPQATTAATPGAGTPATGNGNPPTALAAPAAPASAARPGAWRSTAQMAGTSALQQWHHTQAQAAPMADRVAVRVDAGPALPLRSTIALDQRFAQTTSDEAAADTPLATAPLQGPVIAAGGADPAGQSGHGTGGEAGADTDEPSGTRDDLRADSQDETYEDALAEADAQAEERLDSFASPHLRQASLRIGEDGENAIDVRLSLSGQELDLSFRTDSAEARAELRQHAEGTLADLLQRGGIQLGDVSVSDQGGQHGRDGAAAQSSSRPGTPSARTDTATAAAATPTPPRPRSDGSRPLDLFV
jgi:flagellar hook-length control protein FliK